MKRAIVLFFVMTACVAIFGEKKSIPDTLRTLPSIRITWPQGGEVLMCNKYRITWTSSGYPAGTKVNIYLIRRGKALGPLDGGLILHHLAVNLDIGSDQWGGVYHWSAPRYSIDVNDFPYGTRSAPDGKGYKIRIQIVKRINQTANFPSQSPYFESQGTFTIKTIL